eukprot:TRINITY_DN36510_c0_g1_i1.p1 TRINITY_DN36510_c0_g1~~TRINITY_DN36510_c0_g1_i1.p1  ORF type:complete len:678 (+),score=136.02 TRINITY_DN36510_c0_g1_i1:52-2034(+)
MPFAAYLTDSSPPLQSRIVGVERSDVSWEFVQREADRAEAAARTKLAREQAEADRRRREELEQQRLAAQKEAQDRFNAARAEQLSIVGSAESQTADLMLRLQESVHAADFMQRRRTRMLLAEEERLRKASDAAQPTLEQQRQLLGFRTAAELAAALPGRMSGSHQQPRASARECLKRNGVVTAQLWGVGELHGKPGRLLQRPSSQSQPVEIVLPDGARVTDGTFHSPPVSPPPAPPDSDGSEHGKDPPPPPDAEAASPSGPRRVPEYWNRTSGLKYAPVGGHPDGVLIPDSPTRAVSPRPGDGGGDSWYDPVDRLGHAGELTSTVHRPSGLGVPPSKAALRGDEKLPDPPPALDAPRPEPVHKPRGAEQLLDRTSWEESMKERVQRRRKSAPAQRQLRHHYDRVLASRGPAEDDKKYAARALLVEKQASKSRWAFGQLGRALSQWQEPPVSLPAGYALRRLAEDTPPTEVLAPPARSPQQPLQLPRTPPAALDVMCAPELGLAGRFFFLGDGGQATWVSPDGCSISRVDDDGTRWMISSAAMAVRSSSADLGPAMPHEVTLWEEAHAAHGADPPQPLDVRVVVASDAPPAGPALSAPPAGPVPSALAAVPTPAVSPLNPPSRPSEDSGSALSRTVALISVDTEGTEPLVGGTPGALDLDA